MVIAACAIVSRPIRCDCMTTIAITLKSDHENFIEEVVKSGSYITQSEVVAAALDLLKIREEVRKAHRQELKKEIQKGISELDRGETQEFTAADIKAEGRHLLNKHQGT